jgi:hypothetical protein
LHKIVIEKGSIWFKFELISMAATEVPAKLGRDGDADLRAKFACSDEEWQKVLELRERCKDLTVQGYWATEECLHRFVVARKLDVGAAEKQYRGVIQWRKVSFSLDAVVQTYSALSPFTHRMQRRTRFKIGSGSQRPCINITQVGFTAQIM